MKQKAEVKYQGITANTSDYECHDGELSVSANLISEEGYLKPLPQPKTLFDADTQLGIGVKILFIHATPLFRHYIVQKTDMYLAWADADSSSPSLINFTDSPYNIIKLASIGNTLIALTYSGVFYFNFKPDSNNYKSLGQKPPMVHIQFGLSENKAANYDHTNVAISGTGSNNPQHYAWRGGSSALFYDLHDEYINFPDINGSPNVINEMAWALVNKAEALISEKGHFYAPFIVRYCYRLYDGSQWMHSAPVFMPVSMPFGRHVIYANRGVKSGVIDQSTSSLSQPIARTINNVEDQTEITCSTDFLCYAPNNVALTYKILKNTNTFNPTYAVSELYQDWGDIVKSIDIFVSAPICREDSSSVINKFRIAPPSYQLQDDSVNTHAYPLYYFTDPDTAPSGAVTGTFYLSALAEIKGLTDAEYLDLIHNTSSFYKVASYKLQELVWGDLVYPTEVNISSSVLPNLANQEVMTDDYHYHNNIFPLFDSNHKCITSIFTYNSRMNIACIIEELFKGFPIEALVPGGMGIDGVVSSTTYCEVYNVYVHLMTEQGQRIVSCYPLYNSGIFPNRLFLYNCPLFYPDNRAVLMEIVVNDNGVLKIYSLPMRQHPFLNGATTVGNIMTDTLTPFTVDSYYVPTFSTVLYLPNSLYTSEVLNPFVFHPENINTIGTGRILGLAAATKALSEGQFGQFPLYAFTTDGVWAMSVDSDGRFTAINPVSRDVCTDPDSITSIDTAVLFSTDRGVMLLQGSDTVCITDVLDSDIAFTPSSLSRLEDITTLYLPRRRIAEFLKGCRMLYDYTHQRIIVFNPATLEPRPGSSDPAVILYPYALVLSLKGKTWGQIGWRVTLDEMNEVTGCSDALLYTLNSYPDSLAVTRGNKLVSFSSSQQAAYDNQILVSRPLKLGMSDTIKTIYTLIQRGNFARGHIKTVLYGSRDMTHWHVVGSSQTHEVRNIAGTGYKYFRIVAVGNLAAGESLSGATMEIAPRQTGKLM